MLCIAFSCHFQYNKARTAKGHIVVTCPFYLSIVYDEKANSLFLREKQL
ncbi:hypothetical protein APHCRT_0947 [Anaplasma phagocytophilum str. CRT53-1]|uniref:Uncharacterized protein n=1 Tax=Anaplasma phagocytophilum str. CRT53-1 TaxID=1359157 RepID=A0A0F3Q2S5_ANAPH|nr:hypothetical protein APHCRT_0947 [Anaplasma phagocytophilum str. CRT53-1]